MDKNEINFDRRIKQSGASFQKVVPFDAVNDKLLLMDFTSKNKIWTDEIIGDVELFSETINGQLSSAHAKYGIGGYNEHRTVYARSEVFSSSPTPLSTGRKGEPRRLHLGIDIWGEAGMPVYAALDGAVHSLAYNGRYGDYGATIILQHELNGFIFHSLYGHLSLQDILNREEGEIIMAGEEIAHFGKPDENGYWPSHLHFQVIIDMEGKKGDYPGVCRLGEREKYLTNCPDPDLILNMMKYAVRDL